ncbi:hypothetical protein LOD99_12082 [Oopsacas minuta]|uniref:HAT C-terminal dimerisation domain-containing protein n=1 Tax=Oopsacas minuta TaxID=111878 RepID=A0AAV7JHJ1_9METZ|nr:hypothetical protein LOD99_12082 [Oopsacas minuta]
MSRLEVVTSVDLSDSPLAYSNLSKLSKILLTLPHSNADPERLFSMVKKIGTDSRSLLSPSTTCDLLNIKMDHDTACYLSQDLISEELIEIAKKATRKSLEKEN